MTVAALLENTSSHEIGEWQAYYQLMAHERERDTQQRDLADTAVAGVKAMQPRRR